MGHDEISVQIKKASVFTSNTIAGNLRYYPKYTYLRIQAPLCRAPIPVLPLFIRADASMAGNQFSPPRRYIRSAAGLNMPIAYGHSGRARRSSFQRVCSMRMR